MDTFALTATADEPLPVTNQEEKELRRVFVMLSDYHRKVKLLNEVEALEDLLNGNKNRLTTAQKKDQIINLERFENNAEATMKRIDELKWEMDQLALRNDKSIAIADVSEMLKRLGAKVSSSKQSDSATTTFTCYDYTHNYSDNFFLFLQPINQNNSR
jgi:hypothetical protein